MCRIRGCRQLRVDPSHPRRATPAVNGWEAHGGRAWALSFAPSPRSPSYGGANANLAKQRTSRNAKHWPPLNPQPKSTPAPAPSAHAAPGVYHWCSACAVCVLCVCCACPPVLFTLCCQSFNILNCVGGEAFGFTAPTSHPMQLPPLPLPLVPCIVHIFVHASTRKGGGGGGAGGFGQKDGPRHPEGSMGYFF